LLDVPSGRVRGQAVADGEQDSLSSLVDQLTAQLLGLKAGVEQGRLAGLTSTSLPAVNAYLRGKALFRRGRFGEAEQAFREAVEIDSTFAVAALALSGSVGTDGDERGMHLAWTYRNKLSPADRASAEARAAKLPQRIATDERIAAWVAAAAANPERQRCGTASATSTTTTASTSAAQADALARAQPSGGEALTPRRESGPRMPPKRSVT
jgi:Flp pilus assembly protein TadD